MEVEDRGGVVVDDPGKDRVLSDVVVRSTSDDVETHEIFEVGDQATTP